MARTGTARAAAATFRNTTVSWGARQRLGAVGRHRLDPRPGATLARAARTGQPQPPTRLDLRDRCRGQLTCRPISAVGRRREAAKLKQRDRAEDRRRLVARRRDEVVEAAVTG